MDFSTNQTPQPPGDIALNLPGILAHLTFTRTNHFKCTTTTAVTWHSFCALNKKTFSGFSFMIELCTIIVLVRDVFRRPGLMVDNMEGVFSFLQFH